MRASLSLFLLLASVQAAFAQIAIGQWQDHFPYRQTVAIAEGSHGEAYGATATAIFRYDPANGEMERYTKANLLNDVDIRTIAWNQELQALIVGYVNGNVDMIRGGRSYNLSDIKRSGLVGDKGIYDIHFEGTTAYLACGFGIVVMDLVAQEVNETWLIAPGGAQLRVNALTFLGDSIYAATAAGLYSAWRSAPNLSAFTSWHRREDAPPGPQGPFSAVVALGGRLVINYKGPQTDSDSLYFFDGGWHKVAGLSAIDTRSLSVTSDGQRLLVAHRDQVTEHDVDFTQIANCWGYQTIPTRPVQAIPAANGDIWIADAVNGICRHQRYDHGTPVYPNGPRTASCAAMSAGDGALYVATGAVAGNWTSTFKKEGVHYRLDRSWRTADNSNEPLIASGANSYGVEVNDFVGVAVDPRDKSHAFVASWDDGLLEMRDGHVQTIYNADNSSLQTDPNYGSLNTVFVYGLAYDRGDNLWMTNSNVDAPISVRVASGGWRSFSPGSVLAGNNLLGTVLPASNNFKWIIRPRGNGLLVFNDQGTINDLGDDQYKVLNTFEGQGHLPSMEVYCLAEDKDNEIWVGTGKGVAVFYTPDAVFSSEGSDAQQILIEQGGNVQILLETEAVSAIAVDGANRKWLGTQGSGVYLVSADGTEQLRHFTEENSPLPSNTISALAIDPGSGEVFFGTDRGIMSYRGDATEGVDEASCAKVFPNPVHPSYTGPIAITGLLRDSDVKITDVAGNLVYHTTSLGGQAIWPGTDMNGNRVSTGVYLALATDADGETKCNTRILVVR